MSVEVMLLRRSSSSRFKMKALILLCLTAVVIATKECGKNQHYNSCGSACPVTCENYKDPPEICILMCVPGCHCDAGYVKHSSGGCVKAEECEAKSDAKTCLEEPDEGMCRGHFPSYYYDAKTQTCKEFIYGGCMGNGNRYPTKEACLENCKDTVVWESNSICDLPSEVGLCRGFFPRYYFDKMTGQCTRFVYGGCGGNENNFETEKDCQNQCGKTSSGPKACREEKEVGPCDAAFQRYYFNTKTGKCEQFIYGGCGGNSNNFNTRADCEAVCVAITDRKACQEDMVVGSCKAYFERFFFNKDTGKCEEFIYGGCDGNSNNFNSLEDCESVCVGEAIITTEPSKLCHNDDFECTTGQVTCIPKEWLCDGAMDCTDGSDEENCN